MSASLTVSIVSLILIFATCISITVLVSKALSNAFRTIESMHDRMQAANDKTLDRLMTIRWEDFVASQTYQEDDTGGFFTPDEQKGDSSGGTQVVEPSRWGSLSLLNERLEALDNEQKLLDEDFPPERQAG